MEKLKEEVVEKLREAVKTGNANLIAALTGLLNSIVRTP